MTDPEPSTFFAAAALTDLAALEGPRVDQHEAQGSDIRIERASEQNRWEGLKF